MKTVLSVLAIFISGYAFLEARNLPPGGIIVLGGLVCLSAMCLLASLSEQSEGF